MKPKLVVLVVVMLLLAMVPALAMAKSEAKPEQMVKLVLDMRQPLGPQLDAQLGVTSRGPRAVNAPAAMATRGVGGIRPNAVYALLNEGFEMPDWPGGAPGWLFVEAGTSTVGWDATDIVRKRGQQSLYSAGYNNDPQVNPFYENDMESLAFYEMDLQGARRVQVRFQYMSDTEFNFDYFLWCSTTDGFIFNCYGQTGSTNGKWRLVQLDSRTDPTLQALLDQPFAYYGFVFLSDGSVVDRGTFVDAMRIRAWGPSPIQ